MPSARKPRPSTAPGQEPAITFVVPGQRVDQAATRDGASPMPPAMGLPGSVVAAVQLGLRRGRADDQRVQARPGRDLVVLRLAGGPTLVLHPQHARDLMLAQADPARVAATDRTAPPTEVAVPATLRWQGLELAARGARGHGGARGFLGDVMLTALEVVAGPVEAQAQDLAADEIARLMDERVAEGVYALQPDALVPLKGRPRVATLAMAEEPDPAKAANRAIGRALVFIHGTFGDTVSGFAKLWQHHPQRVRALFEHYRRCVYALDHATLGVSPIANALTLARACPPGARLHLVTYSRGGLVAEVLARAAALSSLDDAAATLFTLAELPADMKANLDRAGRERAQRALAAEQAMLKELVALLRARKVTVERIVRVAAPARGTLLASKRLDAYLSVFKWGMDLAQVPVAPEFVRFMAGVARRRTDPARLPGLAAMIPDSPLIRWLHAAKDPVPGELRVIAGDMQGDSVTGWVKTLLADGFYWTDNDLVVQTRSMYGGAPRAGGATFMLDQGGRVNHFSYFANERTADAVVSGLTQARPMGWRPIGPLSWSGASSTGLRGGPTPATAPRAAQPDAAAQATRPAVFVLPGILGSHLKVGRHRIWLGFRLLGGFGQLRYAAGAPQRVQPDGAVGAIYDDLMAYLGRTHQVVEFSFDWRKPLELEARRLGDAVAAALEARKASRQPVRILAHSMGGLLARTMQLECPAVWDRMMAHDSARLLMLGTPNGGSWAPMQCLSGDDTFGNTLVAFGAPFQDHVARQQMAEFPGFMQLQAALGDKQLALNDHATWQRLAEADLAAVRQHNLWHDDGRQLAVYRWGVPPQAVLDQALALRKRLDAQHDKLLAGAGDKLAMVVGHARFTPDGFDAQGPEGLVYLNAPESGDGRVTLASALLPGVPAWRIDCEHGSLPAARDAFQAYLELLETGQTQRLPKVGAPGTRTRGGAQGGTAGQAAAEPVARVRNRPARERSLARPPEGVDRAALMAQSVLEPGTPPAEGQALRITVHNGDLSFVRQPIMVGHYASNHIAGTERAVDTMIGGTMADSIRMGQYPDQAGTHQLFVNTATNRRNPLQLPRPESVLVVGLGEEGKLKGDDIAKTVRLGVLALAQRLVEQPGGAPLQFELGATLLGSGGAGITPARSAQLVAQGVREANEAIRLMNAGPGITPERRWPSVAHLVLIELYLDRASDAWRALAAQVQATPGFYSLAPTVRAGQGALRRPLDGGYRGSDYDYIRAVGPERPDAEGTIEYTLDTKRARVEVTAQSTQAALVRELVARAANDQSRDRQIGRTLFQLLVPLEIEPFLGGTHDMLLELDSRTAGIPWEMLDTGGAARGGGGDVRPWAIRAKLLRRLRLSDYRARPIDAGADAQVLVIGEPKAPEAYARLPGARDEARAVRDLLAAPQALGGERVVALIAEDDDEQHTGAEARDVINALMSRDWRIVHIAGHGELPEAGNPRGVVLSNQTFLGPREIHNMRVVPELVFVNCCHLAAFHVDQLLAPDRKVGADRAGFASGVAEQLMKLGVRCVVAAGWAVEDEPAKAFATTLYEALLRGARFMDAVAQARESAHALGGNTWAAYQCYGDPEWKLRRTGGDAQRPERSLGDEFGGVASPLALALALETLTVASQFQGADAERQRARIRHLQARFEAAWGSMGAVAEAFAVAWEAAGDREQAVAWYARAIEAEDGSASLKASEQLGNLRVRLAWDRAQRAKGPDRASEIKQALEVLDQALGVLASLAGMQASQERYMLVASALKRRAMIERLQNRTVDARQTIELMLDHCGKAEEAGRKSGTRNLFYPMMSRLAAQCALAASDGRRPELDAAAMAESRQALLDRTRDDPDFWSVVGLTELQLLQALGDGTLAERADALLAEYADLHGRIPAVDKWGSVLDQLHFVLHGLVQHGAPADRRATARLIERVESYLRP